LSLSNVMKLLTNYSFNQKFAVKTIKAQDTDSGARVLDIL